MEWYEHTVRLLTGLAWPAAIGAIVFGFRDRIREMLSRTEQLTLPGGVEWQAQDIADKEENLQAQVAASAPVLVPTENDLVPSDPPANGESTPGSRRGMPGNEMPGGSRPPSSDATAGPGPVTVQREALQEIVQRAAEWGAARGRAGLGVEGTRLDWQADGHPRLVLPRSPRPSPRRP